ncbi:hypothetical protein [Segetibacter sp.]|uniref:hypothetical protein n=1 Tax=Segetibacter sp. TaxID=2231182 RepID=UPI0026072C0D|nr:hypothetical protein [Segetibacter sp.]MCW3078632.1 hypothetical protein [Segetibacter sp.]
MKYIFFLILSFTISSTNGQDLNGIWQGKLTQEPGGCFPEYYIELQIEANNRGINGFSYDYYDTSQYVKLNFSGVYNGSRSRIMISETKVVAEKIPEDCAPCLKTYDLTYSKRNNVETLEGKWVGEDMGTIVGCPPGFIYLKKVASSAFARNFRETAFSQIIIVDSPDVKVDFFDNGIVDGDSVTIFFNNQVAVSNKSLSLSPFTLHFNLQPHIEYEMVLFAESMGTISPTTALVVITSGLKKHNVLISCDNKKNASIKIVYNKKR